MKELLKDIYRTLNPYLKFREKSQIEEQTILYEAFFGRSMSCSPYAIFKALLEDEAFVEYKHVWVLEDFADNKEIMKPYEKYGNVVFVKRKSKEYAYYLAAAKYLVNNSTFPEYFSKRKDQVYVNTWHGIPLKHMGYDMPDGAIGSANTVRNFLQADYLISPNGFHSKMYLDIYKMAGIFKGKVIETGQPRCDALFHSDRDKVFAKLKRLGVNVDKNKKLILYAPTWKGENFSKPYVDVQEYQAIRDFINDRIDTKKYQVLVKPHQTVYKEIKKRNLDAEDMVPATMDTNELLSAVDVLISDYSSIYFDFLVTGKPILFYIPDLKQYENERGLYSGVEELPGPATDKLEKLCDMLRDLDGVSKEWKEKYKNVREWACPYEDGNVSKRVAEIVFKQEGSSASKTNRVGRIYQNESVKKKILFFLGALRSHGITSSMMGLLKNFDYNKYDVTLYIYAPENKQELRRMRTIPKQVRVMVHTKGALGNPVETFQFLSQYNKGPVADQIGRREYRRMFGKATFDYVVDFVGYSPLFAAVAANAPGGAIRSVWQHNDMLADKERKVKGKYVNRDRLEKVFAMYPKFDHLISCSKSVMEVNKKNLGEFEHNRPDYRFARNLIDIERIARGVRKNEGQELKVTDLVTGKEVPVEENAYHFVTMGRLSTEKNQEQLIRAFAALPDVKSKDKKKADSQAKGMLFLLGDGPLREDLKKLIVQLGMEEKIILCGNVENPFAIMKRCKCFVLPSLHEGQPMVILEARVLGLGLIVSDFSTVKDVLLPEGQIVTKTDAAGISKAMEQALAGKLKVAEFDGREYNRQAMEEVYKAIE